MAQVVQATLCGSKGRAPWLGALALCAALLGCAEPGRVITTPEGAALVREDPEFAIYEPALGPAGAEVSPFPAFGALIVTTLEGAALALDQQSLAEAVLTRHCGGTLPANLSYRGVEGIGSTWTSAPCG